LVKFIVKTALLLLLPLDPLDPLLVLLLRVSNAGMDTSLSYTNQ
jgi:hypothetical protein